MIINEAFVINLDRRTDRMAHIIEQCDKNKLKIHRIEAVDGHAKYPQQEKRKRGFFGCYDSHLALLKMLLDVRGDYFLIAEDDCAFADNFRETLTKYYQQLPPTWDMIYLGGSAVVEGAIEDFAVNIKRARHLFCTHCFIIKKESIPDLIKVVETRKWKIDVLFCEYQKTHSCYVTFPELAWQVAGISDVENRPTNNIHLRFNS